MSVLVAFIIGFLIPIGGLWIAHCLIKIFYDDETHARKAKLEARYKAYMNALRKDILGIK